MAQGAVLVGSPPVRPAQDRGGMTVKVRACAVYLHAPGVLWMGIASRSGEEHASPLPDLETPCRL